MLSPFAFTCQAQEERFSAILRSQGTQQQQQQQQQEFSSIFRPVFAIVREISEPRTAPQSRWTPERRLNEVFYSPDEISAAIAWIA